MRMESFSQFSLEPYSILHSRLLESIYAINGNIVFGDCIRHSVKNFRNKSIIKAEMNGSFERL